MATRWFCLLGLTACIGLAVVPVMAQTADDPLERKESRDELFQAEQAVQKQKVSTESFQQELDKLVQQKNLFQREIVNAESKAAYANEKLKHSSTLGTPEEIEKWRGQAESWETRAEAAKTEQAKVDADIQATVQALQMSLTQFDETSFILPGQPIEVFVAEDKDLSAVYQVRRGGYIIMGPVGRIMLAGKDLAGAEKAIKDALAVNYIKDAHVLVERTQGGASADSAVIYLTGEFDKPGPWLIPQGTTPTIVTTILRSGGMKATADLSKVRLLRLIGGRAQVEDVNVQAILDGQVGLTSDLTLKRGDIIMVPAYANTIYVTGSVNRPGIQRLLADNELTVYTAIIRAGGFRRFADRNKVYVLRDLGNGEKKKIPVSIKHLQKGEGLDLILRSKDIVVVPEKFFSL